MPSILHYPKSLGFSCLSSINLFTDSNSCSNALPHFDLPFCPPRDPVPNRKRSYKVALPTPTICSFKSTKVMYFSAKRASGDELVKFRHAIQKNSNTVCTMTNLLSGISMDSQKFKQQAETNSEVLDITPTRTFAFEGITWKLSGIHVEANSNSHGLVDITGVEIIKVNFTYSNVWNLEEPDYLEENICSPELCPIPVFGDTFFFPLPLPSLVVEFKDLPLFAKMNTKIVNLSLGFTLVYSLIITPTPSIPRGAVQIPWYLKTPAQMFTGGCIPFILRMSEMDNIYASLYRFK
ncbi:LOW QUALITY PROTEIN: hypothetical protein RJ641_027982, partial [Dillenia turbinata]